MNSNDKKPVLCSSCFTDAGLRLEAGKIGYSDSKACPNCGSQVGRKLDVDQVYDLHLEFFCNGSFFRGEFGGASRLASNSERYGENEVQYPRWLEKDASLIENKLQVGIFHYGPQLWRFGEIEPLQELRRRSTRPQAIAEIISRFPSRTLSPQTTFYRIRKNLPDGLEFDQLQFDAAPRKFFSGGRLNNRKLAVLYGSEDLEICIHECRVVIPDECFVATMHTTKELNLLDLCGEVQELGSPFESYNLAMRYLFAAESHSYPITQAIGQSVMSAGFDGIWYPSYFSLVKPQYVANIALFGHPVRDRLVEIECINRARLKSASYEIRMGPLFS
jgi:RES domain-containing protein